MSGGLDSVAGFILHPTIKRLNHKACSSRVSRDGARSMITKPREASIGLLLKKEWCARGLKVRPGIEAKELEHFEAVNGVRLPDDMRSFFLHVDGMEMNTSDESELMFNFWPLGRVSPIKDSGCRQPSLGMKPADARYRFFSFADYMIEAEVFSIGLSTGDEASNPVIGWKGEIKANSFGDFAKRYLIAPGSLIHRTTEKRQAS